MLQQTIILKRSKSRTLCDFCKQEKETVCHLFYECRFAVGFWKDFERYWEQKTAEPLRLIRKEIILGIPNLKADLLNYCILLAKKFILNSKLNNIYPTFKHFHNALVEAYNIEKNIK